MSTSAENELKKSTKDNEVLDEEEDVEEVEEEDVCDLHEAERFITFTDAVVAIAMALLILPLMEGASELSERDEEVTSVEFFQEKGHSFGAFAVSFYVVALQWMLHDVTFKYVGGFNRLMVACNFIWMFGIVFMPVGSALLHVTPDEDRMKYLFFIAPLLLANLASFVMCLIVQRDKRTWKGKYGPGNRYLVHYVVYFVFFLLALMIAMLVPRNGAYAFFILMLAKRTAKIIFCFYPNLGTKYVR